MLAVSDQRRMRLVPLGGLPADASCRPAPDGGFDADDVGALKDEESSTFCTIVDNPSGRNWPLSSVKSSLLVLGLSVCRKPSRKFFFEVDDVSSGRRCSPIELDFFMAVCGAWTSSTRSR